MLDYLARLGLPTLVVVTKIDKVGRQECLAAMRKVRDEAGLDEEQVLPFSSRTGEGRDTLLEALEHLLEGVEAPVASRPGQEGS
jgi:GTP-binding protein